MALSKRKRSKRNQSKTEINLLCLNWSDWQESILGDMKKLCLTNNSETKARYVKQVYTIVQNVRQKTFPFPDNEYGYSRLPPRSRIQAVHGVLAGKIQPPAAVIPERLPVVLKPGEKVTGLVAFHENAIKKHTMTNAEVDLKAKFAISGNNHQLPNDPKNPAAALKSIGSHGHGTPTPVDSLTPKTGFTPTEIKEAKTAITQLQKQESELVQQVQAKTVAPTETVMQMLSRWHATIVEKVSKYFQKTPAAEQISAEREPLFKTFVGRPGGVGPEKLKKD